MATINSNLNDEIIAGRALSAFSAALAPVRAFSTSFDSEASRKGDTIQVPLVSTLSAANFTDYEQTGGELQTVSVSLNQHKVATAEVTDVQFANSSAADVEIFAAAAGKAVAQAVIEFAFALVTTGNFGAATVTTYSGTFGTTQIRTLRKALSNSNAGPDRSLILNPDLYDDLFSDSTVVIANPNFGSGGIREGNIGRVLGFDVYESTLTMATNVRGFAVHPSAIAIAVRPLQAQAPSEYLATRVETDTESGISLGYRRHYSPAKGKHYLNFEAVFGASAGVTAGLKMVRV
jgi:hypothetical protein